MEIKAVDLFCGIGGLTHGLIKAGIPVIAGIDFDNTCKYAYTQNNKCKFINKDIHDVTVKEVKQLLNGSKVKIVVGCAPCQPFSRHQKDKKHRSKHKEWSLLYEFSRIIKGVKPNVLAMENVPELGNEKVFHDFLETLRHEGYYIDCNIVNVADYGVPQRRKRLVLLAAKRRQINLIESTHTDIVTVKDAIGFLKPIGAGEKNHFDRLHIAAALSSKNIERIKASKPGGTWRDWPEELMLKCHKSASGQTYSSVYGRMRWDDLSPTMTTQFTYYGTGRFGHPEQNRAITLREGAILQSFPPTYDFVSPDCEVSIKHIARHIGNAVPPRLGEIIGKSILAFLNNSKQGRSKDE